MIDASELSLDDKIKSALNIFINFPLYFATFFGMGKVWVRFLGRYAPSE
jgi:hypothetical protein